MTETTDNRTLERQLEEMLNNETFAPSESFVFDPLFSDSKIYEKADADWKGWWMSQARELDWFTEPTKGHNDSNPPFYKWFEDGTINASYNCLDRHVQAGRGDRVAFHWCGEEGEERDVTYAELLAETTDRFANALKDLSIGRGTSSQRERGSLSR